MGTYTNPPCKDCTERCLGCHSNCDKYKAFQAELQRIKDNKRNIKRIDDFKFERIESTMKNKRRKKAS